MEPVPMEGLFALGLFFLAGVSSGYMLKRRKVSPIPGYMLMGLVLYGLLTYLFPHYAFSASLHVFAFFGLVLAMFYIGAEANPDEFARYGIHGLYLYPLRATFLFLLFYLLSGVVVQDRVHRVALALVFSFPSTITVQEVLDMRRYRRRTELLIKHSLFVSDILGILALSVLHGLHTSVVHAFLGNLLFAVLGLFLLGYIGDLIQKLVYSNRDFSIPVLLGAVLLSAYLSYGLAFTVELGAFFMGFVVAQAVGEYRDMRKFRDLVMPLFFLTAPLLSYLDLSYLPLAVFFSAVFILANILFFSLFGPLLGIRKNELSLLALYSSALGEFSLLFSFVSGSHIVFSVAVFSILITQTAFIFMEKKKVKIPSLFPMKAEVPHPLEALETVGNKVPSSLRSFLINSLIVASIVYFVGRAVEFHVVTGALGLVLGFLLVLVPLYRGVSSLADLLLELVEAITGHRLSARILSRSYFKLALSSLLLLLGTYYSLKYLSNPYVLVFFLFVLGATAIVFLRTLFLFFHMYKNVKAQGSS